MNRDILVDSSYLYAIYNHKDKYHTNAITFAKSNDYIFHIPYSVMIEAVFLARRKGNRAKILFAQTVMKSNPSFLHVSAADELKALDIMINRYADQDFDLVDCTLMALSERLKIRQIATFDRKHFSIYKPDFCDHLNLLPE